LLSVWAQYRVINQEEMAHPTRFERVTFAFGGQTPTPQAERCDGNLPFASRSMTLSSITGVGRDRLLSKAKSHFPAVAQAVGFGLGRSKMLDLSMGID
jgi:hypothetical protein